MKSDEEARYFKVRIARRPAMLLTQSNVVLSRPDNTISARKTDAGLQSIRQGVTHLPPPFKRAAMKCSDWASRIRAPLSEVMGERGFDRLSRQARGECRKGMV
jgi:hypothetical protein